jgi:hypothetical protein
MTITVNARGARVRGGPMRLRARLGRILLLVGVMTVAMAQSECTTYVGVGVGYGYPGYPGTYWGGPWSGPYVGVPVYR